MKTALLAEVVVPEHRHCSLDTASVRRLMDSIREVGLLNPITVTRDNVLVSGLHRKNTFGGKNKALR